MIKSIAQRAVPVTPSDSTFLTATNAVIGTLYIGTSGNLNVLPWEHTDSSTAYSTGTVDGAVLYTNVPVGFFPVAVKKVFATGTTASGIICQYD